MVQPKFFCVIGNRDHLKINGVKEPIWKFISPLPDRFLTSLIYIKNLPLPPNGGQVFFDCGAWSYKYMHQPKWSPAECLEMYRRLACPGDMVAAPDHMVLRSHDKEEEKRRVEITLKNAREFIRLCPEGLVPVAVTHGKNVETRLMMTYELLSMGYRYIAIGGVAGMAGSRKKVTEIIEETCKLREQGHFKIHVLGISALSWVPVYKEYGIDSYDGSAMFYAAFTGATYFWQEEGKIVKYSVKELKPERMPLCNCPACTAIREQGEDTRTMGSNERNMGRAVHNINVYLQVLKTVAG